MTTNLPTEHMVIAGFEAVSAFQRTEAYQLMSGCHASAESARVCWAAMIGELPANVGMIGVDRAPEESTTVYAIFGKQGITPVSQEAFENIMRRHGTDPNERAGVGHVS